MYHSVSSALRILGVSPSSLNLRVKIIGDKLYTNVLSVHAAGFMGDCCRNSSGLVPQAPPDIYFGYAEYRGKWGESEC